MVFIDSSLPLIVSISFVILLVGMITTRLKQPLIIAYIIAGIILGPHGLSLVSNKDLINQIGSLGVVILLFFIGMEISFTKIFRNWKVPVIGTLLQIIISVGTIASIGMFLNWQLERIVLLGFVISLSSTAVVLKILESKNKLDTTLGNNVLGVLLVQDLAIIPMFMIIGLLGGSQVHTKEIILQIIGGVAILSLLAFALRRKNFSIPYMNFLKSNHEMQVFSGLLICFGLALLTGIFGLSTALGSFVAGILIAAAKETEWVHVHLHPFKVVFIALFFVSIGMLLDINFLAQNIGTLALLTVGVLITNTFINAGIIRALGMSWKESMNAGATLAQIGEFSFILGAIGLQTSMITNFAYQTTIAVISITLLFSPAWIILFEKITKT